MSKIYLLNDIKYEGVENLNTFGIKYISSDIDISKYDALIFTSKNAIYSLASFNNTWQEIPSYAIASKTANIINKHNGNVVFTGVSSNGNDFAKELIPRLKNKNVLYVRAFKTVSNLVQILKENNINIEELITYKTSCLKSNKFLEDNSVFIFSSPSSIECFFKNYTWNNSYKAITIGKTTSEYLPNNIEYIMSKETSIDECIKLAKQILN